MIARVWKGWAKVSDADAYEELLREVVYPELRTIEGYIGGYILRHDNKEESEFVTVNLFDSIADVKAFAGSDYDAPVFEPEARRLLSKVEPIVRHYDVKEAPKFRGPDLEDFPVTPIRIRGGTRCRERPSRLH
jgi:heme-degrading monooxygenase HmoA